jgi:hypothetical protein
MPTIAIPIAFPNEAIQIRIVEDQTALDVTFAPVATPVPLYYYEDTNLEITIPVHAPRIINIIIEATYPDSSITERLIIINQQ